MALFLDASAVVKGYLREKGSDAVRTIFARPEAWDALFISDLSLVEVPAAFSKKYRQRLIRDSQRKRATENFATESPALFDVVPMVAPILTDAAKILASHPRRGISSGDGIQLATARWVTEKMQEKKESLPVYHFVAAEKSLLGVAELLGFDTFNPEREDVVDLMEAHRGFEGL